MMVAGIKLKQEEVIQRFKDKHGDKYDYSFVEYINAKTKVKIICPIHGEFFQEAAGHMDGKGCTKCANDATSIRCRGTTEQFISLAKETHGDFYDYSKVLYKNGHAKVNIICKIHGEFLQKPTHHCAGIGCPKCGKEATAKKLKRSDEDFITKARSVHGDKYDYSEMDYKNSATKITVKCPTHGGWSTSPANHLVGSGCPACGMKQTGFSDNKNGTLYILIWENQTKVGVTNRPIGKRLREIVSDSGKKFKILKEYSGIEGGLCRTLESIILNKMIERFNKVNEKYCGSTECFEDVDKAWLLNTVESILKELNGKESQ